MMIKWLKYHWYWLTTNEWSWGWEWYKGKPKLWIGSTYYDGMWYAIHIGKFWVECTPLCNEERNDQN